MTNWTPRLLQTRFRFLPWILLLLSIAGLVGSYVQGRSRGTTVPHVPPTLGELPDPASQPLKSVPWGVFEDRAGGRPMSGGGTELHERFRLAGIFFLFESDGARRNRQAILDDRQAGRQHLVGEGDRIGGVEVVRIHDDHVLLEAGVYSAELWLRLQDEEEGAGGDETVAGEAAPSRPRTFAEMPALSTNRFGKKIQENRWVLKREALMAYYDEMLDAPARMAGLFLSMKPVYESEDNAIGGYRVEPLAEASFFQDMGLEEGDVIRRVNSMAMVSQKRAEYFIREMVNDRLGAVVLDIQRGDAPKKLIYLVR